VVEIDNELAEFLTSLSSKHGLDIERRRRRVEQGHKYWSNVKSDLKIRSGKPAFNHELIIDYDHRVSFDSSLHATAILASHFLDQVAGAPDALGEDVLTYIDIDLIQEINEISGDILEELEKYNNNISSTTGDNELVRDTEADLDEETE